MADSETWTIHAYIPKDAYKYTKDERQKQKPTIKGILNPLCPKQSVYHLRCVIHAEHIDPEILENGDKFKVGVALIGETLKIARKEFPNLCSVLLVLVVKDIGNESVMYVSSPILGTLT